MLLLERCLFPSDKRWLTNTEYRCVRVWNSNQWQTASGGRLLLVAEEQVPCNVGLSGSWIPCKKSKFEWDMRVSLLGQAPFRGLKRKLRGTTHLEKGPLFLRSTHVTNTFNGSNSTTSLRSPMALERSMRLLRLTACVLQSALQPPVFVPASVGFLPLPRASVPLPTKWLVS